jgi:ribosomal protein L11 methylase PrmA
MQSGLYDTLVRAELLIPHEEILNGAEADTNVYKVIQPEMVAFISYPYEWSFSQLKDAALLTLAIQKKAVEFGASLKDCSAYNVQFRRGKPIFIDTLSFEQYQEGYPWAAYRQFCQHFLAPLALMAYTDIRLNQLFRIYIDGVPLDLTSSLLPFRTCLRFSFLVHLHLHAKSQKHFANNPVKIDTRRRMNRRAFLGLIDNLETAICSLKWQPQGTEWANYYEDTNYSSAARQHKAELVRAFLEKIHPRNVWDLGANVGIFSRIASDQKIPTIAFDIDPAAVEKLYRETVKNQETYLFPLLLDLTNPSPGLGWRSQERRSLQERGPADTILALALIHHLAISNNVPLQHIAHYFSILCQSLLIEFVPKQDSQVQRLLTTREDIFTIYTQQEFERCFKHYFTIEQFVPIKESHRILYLMRKKEMFSTDY